MRLHYKLELFSDWHCGSGLSAGADVDLLVIKDHNGMPFVPGKTLKGLISEATDDYCLFSGTPIDKDRLFGKEGEIQATLYFSNAEIEREQYLRITKSKKQKLLYRSIASTAIGTDGIAVDHSLRKMEVTIPLTLEGDIHYVDEDTARILERALGLIKRLGVNRNRGLGRCRFKDIELFDEITQTCPCTESLKFKCTLMSDIILNVKSASEGPNACLDFIPGSCFLGIVAGRLFDRIIPTEQMELFHSGRVRFGDAHPLVGGYRSLRTPASMFTPKLEQDCKQPYIWHMIPNPGADEIKQKQLKQSRTGFCAFIGGEGVAPSDNSKSFSIKSSYDRLRRRAEDSKMYGYESLRKGLEFCFEVECENPKLRPYIYDGLVGIRHIGRSRSAEYGLVKIEQLDYNECQSGKPDKFTVVYAESRLIFLDENGQPKFQPTPEELGVMGGMICWEKSQIRTFQYAPYNNKRRCFDADRCGIEKGSVIVITGGTVEHLSNRYVGSFNNEGFGRVIYNPGFLDADADGRSLVRLMKTEHIQAAAEELHMESTLDQYINSRDCEINKSLSVYEKVRKFVEVDGALFTGKKDKFASQWGTIRGIAMVKQDSLIKSAIEDYIKHGIKKDDWAGKRSEALHDFMKENSENIREAVIVLASEMAKECKR